MTDLLTTDHADSGEIPAANGPTAITSVIRCVPTRPGTVYAAGWTPRLDPQSPDLICPAGEHATLAELMRRAEDDRLAAEREQRDRVWAEAARAAAGEAETVTLAEVMPQPYAGEPEKHETAKPFMRRGRRRPPVPFWALVLIFSALAMFAGAVGGGLVVAGAVRMTGGAW